MHTGSMKYAGTDNMVSIAIAGNRDSFTGTKFHTLDKTLYNDFEKGDTDAYTFTDIDIGLIEFVVVKVEKALHLIGDPDFYLEKLRVSVGFNSINLSLFELFELFKVFKLIELFNIFKLFK